MNPWVGNLPPSWQTAPIKRVAELRFSSVNKHMVEGETPVRLCNYVDVYKNERITKTLDFMAATATDVEVRRFSLRRGDVIITKDSETPDDIGVPAVVEEELPGVICGYHLAMMRPKSGMDGRFLLRALQATGIRDQFHAAAVGITRHAIGLGDVGCAEVPVPPVSVQCAIADFLDRKTAAIDALIAQKERLLELLAEKRQAVITQTVTKGLDSTVPMKDSGVRGVGKVPDHWRLTRLMHMTPPNRPIMYGIVLPGPNVPSGIPIVKSGDCNPERLRLDRLHRTTPEIEAPYARARLAENDVVYAIRGSVGASALVPRELVGANLTQDAARIAPRPGAVPRWLLYLVQSHGCFSQLAAGIVGATVKGINIRDLKRPVVPVPPPSEQEAIADFLDRVTARLDQDVRLTEESIERLREYRQALITEAVTGMLEVREEPPADVSVQRAALILVMAYLMEVQHRKAISLLEVHKAAYFLQAAGESLRLRFEKRGHGPFATNLELVLNDMEGRLLSGYQRGRNWPTARVSILPDVAEQAERALRAKGEVQERLRRVRELVAPFANPVGVELLATVHWVARNGAGTVESAINAVRIWNPDKARRFPPERVKAAWDHLLAHGFLTGLILETAS